MFIVFVFLGIIIWLAYYIISYRYYLGIIKDHNEPKGKGSYRKFIQEYQKIDGWYFKWNSLDKGLTTDERGNTLHSDLTMFDHKIMILSFIDYIRFRKFLKREFRRAIKQENTEVIW